MTENINMNDDMINGNADTLNQLLGEAQGREVTNDTNWEDWTHEVDRKIAAIETLLSRFPATGRFSQNDTDTVSQDYGIAVGRQTTVSGVAAYAEGYSNQATGAYAHAEGLYNVASGSNSHVEGRNNESKHRSQHVIGEYAILDPSTAAANAKGTYIEIVGNGTSQSARQNARTLDWSGNEALRGTITLGKGTADEVTLTAAQLKQLIALLN